MKINKINKTQPTVPFEKKKSIQCKFVDMGFFEKDGSYKEDWQVVRVDELKGKK